MASSTEHPAVSTAPVNKEDHSTLLGYFWNLREDWVSTNKSSKINLYPARRGIRSGWGNIFEAEDLFRLQKLKPLTNLHALACAQLLYDPIGSTPLLAAALKYMYRYLIMTSSLEGTVGANYDKILSEYFVREPAVALAIATKKRLQTRRSWRLPQCIP